MKILLIGEYSRLHNSLKEGSSNLVLAYLNKITLRAFKFNLESIEKGIRFYFILPQLQNYDVVQLINSNAIETFPRWSMYLLRKVFSRNHKIFLLVCGEETPIIAILLTQ